MNVWRGSFRSFFLFFSLIYLNNLAAANTHCINPITEEDIERQCGSMISNFKVDTDPSIVVDQVVQSVLSVVNIDDKGTFGLDKGYRVSRIEIALFGESSEELFFNELRNYGDELNRDIILVKSCQGEDDDRPGDYYATASVQIFLEEVDELSLNMWATDTVIHSGEASTLSFRLYETECPKKGEAITLRKDGPGRLPDSVVTDDYGRAQTQFMAEEKGEARIRALHEEESTEVEITVRPLVLWDLDCSVHYWKYDPDFPRTGWNDDHWKSQVRFVDMPLTQLAETDFTVVDEESSESPSNMKLYMRWLRIKKFYESRGTFYDSRFTVYDGETLHHGKAEADPVWIFGVGAQEERFDYSQRREDEEGLKSFIFFKLKPKTIVVSISEKAGVKTPWSERFERRFRFPREEILAGKPFVIDFAEPGAGDIHSDVDIRFSPREVTISEGGGVP